MPQGLKGMKFPRLSPILLLHHPDFLPNSVFSRTSASPESLSSYIGLQSDTRYETYYRSKSPCKVNNMGKSNIRNQGCEMQVSAIPKPNREIPISPRVTILRNSVQKNINLPRRHHLSGNNLPHHLISSSQNDVHFKRAQVYYPKKAVAEKREVLRHSKESLIFHSAESHSDVLKLGHEDFHPDFDIYDLV